MLQNVPTARTFMLNQTFSSKNFLRLLQKRDVINYDLGEGVEDYTQKLEAIAATITGDSFQFSPFKKYDLSHGSVISPSCLQDDFALRKLNDNIKRVFNVKTIDRNRIIPQVKVLLAETGEYWLQKLDLKRFFESISRQEVLRIICDDPRLSYESKKILEKLFASPDVLKGTGLPRGISLSSTLSELYMQKFDTACRMLDKCYFYTRYVDDIILLFHEDPKNVLDELAAKLPPGLTFNAEKCAFLHRPKRGQVVMSNGAQCVTYLGYEFTYVQAGANKASELQAGIASKKIEKIKTRIALSLFDYCKNQNYELLKNRLRFIASNYRIGQDSGSGNLYAGIHYNHSMIDKARLADLRSIDGFIRSAIFSKKGSLGKRLNPLLDIRQRRELCRFSLFHGHQHKIVRAFEPSEFYDIKSIWNHV